MQCTLSALQEGSLKGFISKLITQLDNQRPLPLIAFAEHLYVGSDGRST